MVGAPLDPRTARTSVEPPTRAGRRGKVRGPTRAAGRPRSSLPVSTQMLHRLRRRPSSAMVVALLALFVALDGPATAARLIDGRAIKEGSITNKQVRNGTLGTQDLSKTALKRLQVTPAGSVAATQLARKSVDASKLADGAVGGAALAPGSVDATKLTDGLIGPGQLGAGAVTGSKLADGAVGAAALLDGGLQTRDIGDFYGSVMVKKW